MQPTACCYSGRRRKRNDHIRDLFRQSLPNLLSWDESTGGPPVVVGGPVSYPSSGVSVSRASASMKRNISDHSLNESVVAGKLKINYWSKSTHSEEDFLIQGEMMI